MSLASSSELSISSKQVDALHEFNGHQTESSVDLAPNTYQIRPSVHDTFKTSHVREIIEKVLSEVLTGKRYSESDAKKWYKQIADEISTRVKDLGMRRYKHIVHVVLGNQLGAGCKFIARCRWDAECDNQTSDVFTNSTIFCVVTVFGIYHY